MLAIAYCNMIKNKVTLLSKLFISVDFQNTTSPTQYIQQRSTYRPGLSISMNTEGMSHNNARDSVLSFVMHHAINFFLLAVWIRVLGYNW